MLLCRILKVTLILYFDFVENSFHNHSRFIECVKNIRIYFLNRTIIAYIFNRILKPYSTTLMY